MCLGAPTISFRPPLYAAIPKEPGGRTALIFPKEAERVRQGLKHFQKIGHGPTGQVIPFLVYGITISTILFYLQIWRGDENLFLFCFFLEIYHAPWHTYTACNLTPLTQLKQHHEFVHSFFCHPRVSERFGDIHAKEPAICFALPAEAPRLPSSPWTSQSGTP